MSKKKTEAKRPHEEQQDRPLMPWQRRGGLELRTLDDAWRFATAVTKSGLAPKGLDTPEKVLIAMQMGAELGMPPLSSLQNIAVINGRPFLTADLMLAVVRASGLFDEAAFVERIENRDGVPVAICQVRRKPDGKPIVREFSLDDAKRAGLLRPNTPWAQYPLRMLQMRARSWALRDTFSDLLKGMRAVEDVDVETVEVVDVTTEPEPQATKDVKGVLDTLAEQIAPPEEPQNDTEYAGGQEPEQEETEEQAPPKGRKRATLIE